MDSTKTITTVERQLIDVVVRHELAHVPLDERDFTDGMCARYWSAITTLWQRGRPPSIENVHAELLDTGVHTSPRDAADLMFLPLGFRAHVDDYVALIAANARRRRLAMLFADAAVSIERGADPDVVLRRIEQLAG